MKPVAAAISAKDAVVSITSAPRRVQSQGKIVDMRRRTDRRLEEIPQVPGADPDPAGKPRQHDRLLDIVLHQPHGVGHPRIIHAQARRQRLVGVKGWLLVAEQPADLERQRIALTPPDDLQHQVHGRQRA